MQLQRQVKRWQRQLSLGAYSNGQLMLGAVTIVTALAYGVLLVRLLMSTVFAPDMTVTQFLSDPFLQWPTESSVRVVWFTEFEGDRHRVQYGPQFERVAIATSKRLSRLREDQKSRIPGQAEPGQLLQQPQPRPIWRHEAEVKGLSPNSRLPYRVVSRQANGDHLVSRNFTLAAAPSPGTPLKILLTSDHQLMPLTPANLQKVVETVGRVDAVFLAGDLVNIPDRASEWFDDQRGGAFFPSLQGRASAEVERNGVTTRYRGGEIIQHAPLFTAAGNHEVMGRFSAEADLGMQFGDAIPRAVAEQRYLEVAKIVNPAGDAAIRDAWIRDHSFNTITYEEILTLPTNPTGGQTYYAVSFGDVRLIVLFATNIWRRPSLEPDVRGRYRERQDDLADPDRWGHGQHIFEPIAPGSTQYEWLRAELERPEFRQATYKLVMLHHPPHSLGDNIVPAYTDPVPLIERDGAGQVTAVRYEYPKDADYLVRDVVPLLDEAGVQLMHYGHSHLWNRFVNPSGMIFLESSNVGNTYGAFWGDQSRPVPQGYREIYAAVGDPNGLSPIPPTLAPLLGGNGQPLPFIASNDIAVFSILDTATGTVSSYRFDASQPDLPVIKFDEFALGRP